MNSDVHSFPGAKRPRDNTRIRVGPTGEAARDLAARPTSETSRRQRSRSAIESNVSLRFPTSQGRMKGPCRARCGEESDAFPTAHGHAISPSLLFASRSDAGLWDWKWHVRDPCFARDCQNWHNPNNKSKNGSHSRSYSTGLYFQKSCVQNELRMIQLLACSLL